MVLHALEKAHLMGRWFWLFEELSERNTAALFGTQTKSLFMELVVAGRHAELKEAAWEFEEVGNSEIDWRIDE
jgi:hypothetical protein